MSKNISCDIIQDLLPSYVEGIISNESKDLIESHINTCSNCKKEFENMSLLIEIEPIEEKKLDYFKEIHKKCRNILIICILLNLIAFIGSIFYTDANVDEALFTLILYLFVIILISTKFLLPLLGAIVSILAYKKTKKKWLLLPFLICASMLLYSFFIVIENTIKYGF